MNRPLPLPRALAAIREALDTLVMQRSSFDTDRGTDQTVIEAGQAAVLQIEAAATKVHDTLSLYHAMAADTASEWPEVQVRAEDCLRADAGALAASALTVLGLAPKGIKGLENVYVVEDAT